MNRELEPKETAERIRGEQVRLLADSDGANRVGAYTELLRSPELLPPFATEIVALATDRDSPGHEFGVRLLELIVPDLPTIAQADVDAFVENMLQVDDRAKSVNLFYLRTFAAFPRRLLCLTSDQGARLYAKFRSETDTLALGSGDLYRAAAILFSQGHAPLAEGVRWLVEEPDEATAKRIARIFRRDVPDERVSSELRILLNRTAFFCHRACWAASAYGVHGVDLLPDLLRAVANPTDPLPWAVDALVAVGAIGIDELAIPILVRNLSAPAVETRTAVADAFKHLQSNVSVAAKKKLRKLLSFYGVRETNEQVRLRLDAARQRLGED